MAKTKRRRRKSYGRRSGLAGITEPVEGKKAGLDVADIVIGGAATVLAAKGFSILDRKINPSGKKMMSVLPPALALLAGGAGAVLLKSRLAKAACKGIAIAGAIKGIEKVTNRENLLSGVDDDTPLMLPGIGSYGQAALPELSQYSENPNADVTTTGNDPQYYMGQPSEVLSGDDEIIAY